MERPMEDEQSWLKSIKMHDGHAGSCLRLDLDIRWSYLGLVI